MGKLIREERRVAIAQYEFAHLTMELSDADVGAAAGSLLACIADEWVIQTRKKYPLINEMSKPDTNPTPRPSIIDNDPQPSHHPTHTQPMGGAKDMGKIYTADAKTFQPTNSFQNGKCCSQAQEKLINILLSKGKGVADDIVQDFMRDIQVNAFKDLTIKEADTLIKRLKDKFDR